MLSDGEHDHLPLPYQSLDEEGTIIDVNSCWCDTLGYTRGEVIGNWFGELMPPGQRRTFKQQFTRFKKQGYIRGCKLQLTKKDGDILHASFNGRIAYADDGSIERTHCMFEDVTRLRETEERFRHLYEHATVGLYQTTPDGRITMANPAAVDMLGYDSFEELAERDLENAGYEPGYPRSIFKKAMEEDGEVHGLESAWKRKDGSTIYVRESAKAYYDDDGSIRCYEGSVEDITEQKKAEKKLRESMERYQALYQRSMDAVYAHDLQGQFIDANRAALDMLGYTKQELTVLSFEELLDEDQLPLAYETLEKIRETGAQDELTEFRLLRRDGSHIWVETTASLIYKDGEPHAIQGIARDITAEKKAREKIRRWTTAIESSIDGIAVLNADEEYIYLNQAHARINGYGSPDELLGKTWHMLYDEAWRQRFEEEFMPRLRRQGHWRGEAVGRKKDGSAFPQEVSLTVLDDGGLICVVRDITEREQAERELQRLEHEKSLILDNINEILAYHDPDHRIIWANKAYLDATGLTLKEIKGKKCYEVWGLDRECNQCPVTRAMAAGKPHQGELTPQNQPHWPSGQGSWEISGAPVKDTAGDVKGAIEVARDVTEQKQTNRELKQSLEEKDVLLREVHHRVKNNLQVISSMLQMESIQHDDPEARQALQDMQLRVKSMGLIHEHLYRSPELSHVDVQEYLSQLAYNVMQTYSPESALSLDVDVQEMDLPLDTAIPCGLVATELLSNAFRHAFPDGQTGTIHLSARCSDGNCMLTVSDDGVGIGEAAGDSETLGLQLVDLLAAQLDGTIEFAGGEGTTATLRFSLPGEVAA
ncbi:MAG: PAS domain S-box protein [Thermoplasmatota archaeon]